MGWAFAFGYSRCALAMLLLCASFAGALPAHAAQALRVAVALSEEGGAYAEVATAIRDGLAREGGERFRVTVFVANRERAALASTMEAEQASLIVTVGMRAANAVNDIAPRVPVLFTLIPKTALDRLMAGKAQGSRSGIYLDQPLERQLELIRLVIPAATRVGVIYGPDSAKNASTVEATASAFGLKIEAETVTGSDQVTTGLRRVLERGEVLLGLPDPEVFNASTVHNLLLAAYRSGDAVFAFSPAYVKAGALAGVFSSSAHIGAQAAEIISKFSVQSSLPGAQFPKYFGVSVNRSVARSMGIPIDEEGALQQKLQNLAEAGN